METVQICIIRFGSHASDIKEDAFMQIKLYGKEWEVLNELKALWISEDCAISCHC